MVLHMVLTASFVVLPLAIRDTGFAPEQHWMLYLPVMVMAFVASIPFIIIAEVKQRMKLVFLCAIAILALCQFAFIQGHHNVWILGLLIWLFFSAFNLLEATLPSLIAKIAPVQSKGTAMGFYSSSQFIGAFIGGAGGGALYGQYGFNGVFIFCATILLLWLLFASSMREPRYISTFLINVGDVDTERAKALEIEISQVNGVAEVTVNAEDGVAYLKIDPKVTESDDLLKFSAVDPNVD
jgi:MFS family permease